MTKIDLPAVLREFGADMRLRDSESMGPTRCEVALATEVARLRAQLAEAQTEADRRTREVEACYTVQRDLRTQLAEAERERDALRELVAEARRLIVARGESLDWPLQTHQHRFIATCNELGIAAALERT